MTRNYRGYKTDLIPFSKDDGVDAEIDEKAKTLQDALYSYFGNNVTLEDVIALSATIDKAKSKASYDAHKEGRTWDSAKVTEEIRKRVSDIEI